MATQLTPATLEEEHIEESIPNNELGESYVADIQHSSRHIPLHCTVAQEHKRLTKYFNEHQSAKIFDTFKDHFSNVNVDSIQKTYPKTQKIGVYNKIIGQYVKETNMKYGLNL